MNQNNNVRIMRIIWRMFLVAGVIFFVYYCLNSGQVNDVPLDMSYAEETNPLLRMEMVESANIVHGRIMKISSPGDFMFDAWNIDIELLEENTFSYITVYIPKNEVRDIHVGDIIDVKGSIRYRRIESYSSDDVTEFMYIGDTMTIPPFIFKAHVVKNYGNT